MGCYSTAGPVGRLSQSPLTAGDKSSAVTSGRTGNLPLRSTPETISAKQRPAVHVQSGGAQGSTLLGWASLAEGCRTAVPCRACETRMTLDDISNAPHSVRLQNFLRQTSSKTSGSPADPARGGSCLALRHRGDAEQDPHHAPPPDQRRARRQ